MDYSTDAAQAYLGKRVVVSLRTVAPDGSETFSGFWGVIDSAQDDGMLLRVEGGLEDEFWMMPPDFDAFVPATQGFYQMDGSDEVVVDVDYEAYWAIAERPEDL